MMVKMKENENEVEVLCPEDQLYDSQHLVNDDDVFLKDENENGLSLKDHFTLSTPTSTVTFGNKTSYLVTNGTEQITFEKIGENIQVKQTSTETAGFNLLRGAYTLVAVLMVGFVFVFCCQLVLFLFMGLAIQSGSTSKQDNFNGFTVIGVFLSIPTIAVGLASMMNIASSFVLDTWRGHHFTKTIFSAKSVFIDWITLFIFFLIPMVVGTACLYAQNDKWWEITCLTWFISVFFYYVLYAITVIYYELRGCYEMVRYNKENDKYYEERSLSFSEEFFDVIKRAILMRQNEVFSGTMVVRDITWSNESNFDSSLIDKPDATKQISFLSKMMIKLVRLGLYKDVSPTRIFDIDEVRDRYPIVTSHSWGLERIYFRNRQDHFIAIVGGRGAITDSQARSSFICAIIGQILILLTMISFLVWFQIGPALIALVIIAYAIFSWERAHTAYALRQSFSKVSSELGNRKNAEKALALYYVERKYKIVEPTTKLSWVLVFVECFLFGLYPIMALFASGDKGLASVFTLIAISTIIRRYISAAVSFRALGTLDGIEKNNENRSEDEEWREKNRLSNIVANISQGRGNNFWIGVFTFFLLVFSLLFTAAVNTGTAGGYTKELRMVDDFIYEGNAHFPYPTCSLGKGIEIPSSNESALADFTFLSAVAYLDPNITQDTLDNWFKNGTAIDQYDVVKKFHNEYEEEKWKTSVSYKLIEFPSNNLKIVAIRGTHTSWDALTDAQLWSSAALAQYIRSILPLGEVWNPILRHLVKLVSIIESESLKEVSFYKETSAFVQKLKREQNTVALTGHSLGGGLAMISGVQTQSPALAVSGPNSLISRDTFDPPLSEEGINMYTFNIIPDRDPVPRIDEPGQNYQRVSCTANVNDPINCHKATRTLCEILYTCGTQGRPVLCDCHDVYGYPKPIAVGNRTYEDACASE